MTDTTRDTQDMQMYAAANGKGLSFLCSEVNTIPADAILLEKDVYNALLEADGKGASLTIQNGNAVALDWKGNVIDLSTMTEKSTYGKPPSLKEYAQEAMQNMQQKAAMVTAMGETFGPHTRAYVQSLRAIIDGSDTTSTELPTAPDDVTT